MAYSCTYSGLKADLLENADDYSSEFMAHLDSIIAEGETMVLRDLDLEIFKDFITSAGSLTAGQRTFTRPSGIVKIDSIYLVVSGSRKFIDKRTQGYCEMYGEDATQALPRYYAETSESSLYFVATPDQAYQVLPYGIVRPAGLSDTTPETWLGTNAGDLLYMACKIRSEQYLADLTQAGMWAGEYNNKLLPNAKIELRGMSRATYEAAKVVAAPSQAI